MHSVEFRYGGNGNIVKRWNVCSFEFSKTFSCKFSKTFDSFSTLSSLADFKFLEDPAEKYFSMPDCYKICLRQMLGCLTSNDAPGDLCKSTLISLINVEVGINVEGVQKLPNHYIISYSM